jgi:hypothetical protein
MPDRQQRRIDRTEFLLDVAENGASALSPSRFRILGFGESVRLGSSPRRFRGTPVGAFLEDLSNWICHRA